MAYTLFPSGTDDQTYSQTAHSILDQMILCGNRVAEARKEELCRIEGLFQVLSKRVEQEGLRTLTLSDRANAEIEPAQTAEELRGQTPVTEPGILPQSAVRDARLSSTEPLIPPPVDSLDIIGISSYEFLSIVDQLDNPEISYGVLDAGPEWLEGGDPTDSFV